MSEDRSCPDMLNQKTKKIMINTGGQSIQPPKLGRDIALLELDRRIDFKEISLVPVCLPPGTDVHHTLCNQSPWTWVNKKMFSLTT
jgi:hypothetical protein